MKEKVVDDVVEVEVEETVEEKVKEEVEEKVVEKRVVEEKAVGAERCLMVFWGARTAGSILDLSWDPAVLAVPSPPDLDHPLLVPPGSPIWTLRFLMHRVHHKILGQGRWVWVDEGGFTRTNPSPPSSHTLTQPCAVGPSFPRSCPPPTAQSVQH